MSPTDPELMPLGQGRPVIFGEVLFDTFEDGSAVLGGAPFNVAWHLQGFGLAPLFISRVGDDEPGARVLQTMRDWGMDTQGVQVDPDRPTGRVEVRIEGGQPSFDIVPDQAYDFVEPQPAMEALDGAGAVLLYHGSLSARNEVSRGTLMQLRRRHALPVFVDVNLRPPWWTKERINELVSGARWVKLNDHELRALGGTPSGGLNESAAAYLHALGFELLIVTLGTDGALVASGEGIEKGDPVVVEEVADTVGAGDAFSAVTLYGLIRGWAASDTLQRAMEFAAQICRRRGATTTERELYRGFQARWRGAGETE
ncbi:MAG TPA: carbohydrate kinase [Gammaproteobacteria bacterium]|nr:carbohydrate kinase [Gammaproteobacteria bacterium]